MSTHIKTPKNADVAVVMLPDGQNPYGDGCKIDREIQSILFHYGLRDVDVAVLDKEGFTSADKCQWVNPDGDDDCHLTFEECIAKFVKPKLFVRPIKAAIRRILAADPFAAVVTPPAKRPRTDDDNDAATASSASSKAKDGGSKASKSLSKSSSKTSSKSSSKATSSKSSKIDDVSGTDSSASDAENDDAGAGSSAGVNLIDYSNLPCIPGTSTKAKDLNQLFSAVGTEVSLCLSQ